MNRFTNVGSPTGRVSVFSEGTESPMPPRHPLDSLISSLRFGEELCQGGQEDHQSLRNLATVGFSSPGVSAGTVPTETTRKIIQIQQKILRNSSDKTIIKDIRDVLAELRPLCDRVGSIGSPALISFTPILNSGSPRVLFKGKE